FRAIKDMKGWSSWKEWEGGLRHRDQKALEEFVKQNEHRVLFFKYLQWVIQCQWDKARKSAAGHGVLLSGDLPFMVNLDSSDVWSRQNEFDTHCTIGAPPDAFSEEGQKWGLPAYRWHSFEASDFWWWRMRVKRAVQLYDVFRLDHMVGFFRTWIIPDDKSRKPDFDWKDPHAQKERGIRFLKAVSESAGDALPVAEDLGVIPPFVRTVLADFEIPGYKIMRWEKKGKAYIDPSEYPSVSLAATGTHDTETLLEWWNTVDRKERKLFWAMVSGQHTDPEYCPEVREKVLRSILSAASNTVLLPVQDVIGISDRINMPGTVGAHNWTFRMPVSFEKMGSKGIFASELEFFKNLAIETGRVPAERIA
ncbi:MAG TPA: 4-alpha-glucanotransferase, partial [bacterium]|nr:4-alpha-glucanotransferase [bacterium]